MEENKEMTPEEQALNPESETISQDDTDQVLNDIESATIDPREEELINLRQQAEEQKDKYLRLYADFDNYKKRNARERLDLMLTANKEVIKELLPVLDDFERAMRAAETATEVAALVEGMQLIYHKLNKNLEAKGLKPIVAKGEAFDVELHEAITEIPAPSPEMVGKVIDEVEKGYYLNDKIIRFAKVVVGK